MPDLLDLGRLLGIALELDEHDDSTGQQGQAIIASDDTEGSHRSELDRLAADLVYDVDVALLSYLL